MAQKDENAAKIVEHQFGSDTCYHVVLNDKKVKCLACAHGCVISDGKFGICAIRKNVNGVLKLIVYGHAMCVNGHDNIEKKPLYHVKSGSYTFSMGSIGCNFACEFCQNWDLSQCSKEIKKNNPDVESCDAKLTEMGYELSPQVLVEMAKKNGNRIMAFTYNEPTIFIEYALDVATLAKKEGMTCIFKSNGYETEYAVDRCVGLIDAFNIDLKSFSDKFYRTVCKARLQPVLDTIRRLHERKIWVEVTTLVIPNENDSDEELTAIAEFIASVSKDIPWHVTPFHPDYKMTDKHQTPSSTLHRGYLIGKKAGLKYVYARAGDEQNTNCTQCNSLLVEREGLSGVCKSDFDRMTGKCKKCGTAIPGVWGE